MLVEAEGKISRLEKQVSDLKEVEKELEEKLRASEDSISTKDSELSKCFLLRETSESSKQCYTTRSRS